MELSDPPNNLKQIQRSRLVVEVLSNQKTVFLKIFFEENKNRASISGVLQNGPRHQL